MDDVKERERATRAEARRSWPIRKFRLGEEPDDDLSDTTTAKERLEMMWPMTVDAWTLAGKEIPDYPRDKAPVRVIRRSGQEVCPILCSAGGSLSRKAGEGWGGGLFTPLPLRAKILECPRSSSATAIRTICGENT